MLGKVWIEDLLDPPMPNQDRRDPFSIVATRSMRSCSDASRSME